MVQRQVDAIERMVIGGAILQVIEHLQRGAERIGWRPGVAAFAMKIEQLPPDGRRRIAAIAHQIVPVAVAQLCRIEPEGMQHVMTMLRGNAGLGEALAHRQRGRRTLARWAVIGAVQDRRHPIESSYLVVRG